MNPNQDGLLSGDGSLYKGKVLNVVDGALVCNASKCAELSWNCCFTHALYKAFIVATVFNELGNGRQQQVVFCTELTKVWQTHHGAVIVLNFTDNCCRFTPCQTCQINTGFCMASTLQHATVACAQRKDMAGAGK